MHERYHRLIYNDKKSSFQNLLGKGKSVSIHKKHGSFAIKIYKVHCRILQELLNALFPLRQAHQ